MILVHDKDILNNMTAGEILSLSIGVLALATTNIVVVFRSWVVIQKKITELEIENKNIKERTKELSDKVDCKVDMLFLNEFKADFLTRFEEIKQLIEKFDLRFYEHTHEKN